MLCIASKLILPWFKFIFLLPGNGKDYENEFKLQKKKHTEIMQCHFAFYTESFHTENYRVHGLLTQATIV